MWKRSRTQSLADALGDLAHRALTTRSLPAQDAASPHLMLLTTPDQLDGPLPGGQWSDGTPASPGEVATVLCDAVVTPIVVDTRGRPLAVGQEQKCWPRWMRRAVAVRDRGCAFPGCSASPRLCHVHHMRHYAAGGPTDVTNGCLLCPFHHYLVHNQGWLVRLSQLNGRPEFVPPEWLGGAQAPQQHLRFRLPDPLLRRSRPPASPHPSGSPPSGARQAERPESAPGHSRQRPRASGTRHQGERHRQPAVAFVSRHSLTSLRRVPRRGRERSRPRSRESSDLDRGEAEGL